MFTQPNERLLLVKPKIKIIHNDSRLDLLDIICLEQYTSSSNYLTTSKSLSLYWSVTTSIKFLQVPKKYQWYTNSSQVSFRQNCPYYSVLKECKISLFKSRVLTSSLGGHLVLPRTPGQTPVVRVQPRDVSGPITAGSRTLTVCKEKTQRGALERGCR